MIQDIKLSDIQIHSILFYRDLWNDFVEIDGL